MALRLDLIDLCGIDRHELIPAILIIPLKGDNLFVGVSTREITGDFAGLSARQPLSSSNSFKFCRIDDRG